MLDKKTESVLNMLVEKVGYGFKVVKKQDLAESLPKKSGVNAEELARMIAFLRQNDYLVVKYQDKEEICLALTVKTENYLAEKRHTVQKSKIAYGQIWLLFLGVFAAAFLGALAATLLGKIL